MAIKGRLGAFSAEPSSWTSRCMRKPAAAGSNLATPAVDA